MKKVLCLILALFFAMPVFAEYVQGYYKSNGTYVNGYHRTTKDYTKYNNYSTKGNVNPYTGKKGTVNPNRTNNYKRKVFY